MAGERKNSNQANSKKHTNRTTGKRKAAGSKKVHNQKNDVNRELFRNEIILMVTLVISLLLILSNFNLSGKVGGVINGFTFGLFGFIAYLLPFILFFGIAFYIANRGNSIALRKLISSISLGVVLTAFIQMITLGYSSETQIIDFYLDSSEQKNGGGLIGGLICKLLHPLFGTVGTFIILIALIFIFIMFITGKALLTYLGIKSEASIQQIKDRRAQQEEEYNTQLEEGKVNRRPARTVLLKKSPGDIEDKDLETGDISLVNTDGDKNKSVSKTNSSLKGNGEKGNDDGFLNLLKKKKSKNTVTEKETNPGSNFDMEEILPIDIDNIPIHRAGNNYDDAQGADKNSTYEEQLKSKFGKAEDHTTHSNPERPGIDADIERLLQAAGRDSMEEAGTEYFENANKNVHENINLHENTNLTENVSLNANMNLNANSGTNSDLDSIYNDNFNNNINSNFKHNSSNPIDFRIDGDSSETLTEPFYSSQAGTKREAEGNTQSHMNLSASDVNEIKMNQMIEEKKEYVFPPMDLLSKPKADVKGMSDRDLKETAVKLQKTLESFGVRVTVTNVSCGPAVTRYELQPEQGVKVSRITGLADDIKLNLAAADVRIEAPIPGKAAVGIEVPNKENSAVMFRELIESKDFKKHPSDIAFAVGKDIGGQTIVTDIGKMPHLLIAGATGSGKSVCINTLIMSILYKAKPSDVKMIMVDPKVVELSVYNGIPHLLIPVVTDPKKASAALNWAVMEMTERYKKFADLGVRDVKGYNEKIATVEEYQDERYQKLPQIVIIVDELADLMMVAPGEVEDAICRLAQMARAAGLHLIIATQRPSVNVITGLIKANIPSRIAFSVSSAIDSRTIIDGSGAEKLLGKGDMLFFPSGYPKPIRVQGAFISDKEVGAVVEFLTSSNSTAEYNEEIANKITSVQVTDGGGGSSANERDDYFIEAGKFIIDKDKASIGMLQRVYKIGFNRAARIMDQLAEAGVVGPEEGTKPRKILMTLEEFEQYVDEYI